MPVKRRIAKGRHALTDSHLEDLIYGPGTCLINGEGYLGPHGDGLWRDATEEVKQSVLAEMRADWQRQSAAVHDAWQKRTPHDRYIARQYHGDPAEPWALREFGEP